jgi:hypothetical protein
MKPKLITTKKKTRSRGVTDDPYILIIKVKLENRRKPTSPGKGHPSKNMKATQ